MKRIFSILYFQLYNFYKFVLKEDDPHFQATWAVGIGFSFLIVFPFTAVLPFFTCKDYPTIYYVLFSLFVYFIFYKYFSFNGRRQKIVKEKPLLFGSKLFSKVAAILFMILVIGGLFFWPIIGRIIIDKNCF